MALQEQLVNQLKELNSVGAAATPTVGTTEVEATEGVLITFSPPSCLSPPWWKPLP